MYRDFPKYLKTYTTRLAAIPLDLSDDVLKYKDSWAIYVINFFDLGHLIHVFCVLLWPFTGMRMLEVVCLYLPLHPHSIL